MAPNMWTAAHRPQPRPDGLWARWRERGQEDGLLTPRGPASLSARHHARTRRHRQSCTATRTLAASHRGRL